MSTSSWVSTRKIPRVQLERTEFVRADSSYSILARIVRATEIDTILHTHLIVDSTSSSGRALHEINVIGTMNLLAAAGAPGSPVRKVVLKSSSLVYGANYRDPNVFREEMTRTRAPRTGVERSLLEVEAFLRDFADDNPHVTRDAAAVCERARQQHRDPVRAGVEESRRAGDPRLRPPRSVRPRRRRRRRVMYATTNDVPGVFNVAGDGNLPWSEVCAIVGRRRVPLPPVLTALAAEPMRIAGVWDLPPEALMLLRYGRTIDNTRYKRAGFRYEHTSAGTVEAFAQGLRLAASVGDNNPTYKYQREVEDFFRHSPAVLRPE